MDAASDSARGVAPVQLVARGMPLISEKTLRLTNASTAFAALAAEGSTSDEKYAVLAKHIKQIRAEFGIINRSRMANRQPVLPIPSAVHTSAIEVAENDLGATDGTESSLDATGWKK